MKSRILALAAPAMLFGLFAVAAYAADATHDGKVVSATAEKLTMAASDGTEHSHNLTAQTKITLDGKAAKATDLKKDMKIRVTTKADDKTVCLKVQAIDKNPDFEKPEKPPVD